MITLANKYNMTRQGIHKMLRLNGIDTSKHHILVTCSACGEEVLKPKSLIRNRVNTFCGMKCYTAYLQAGNGSGPYIKNRHGQRLARAKVSKYFDLQPGNIVHHKDRNTLNNMLDNLAVFKNQGDHIRFHRLGEDYVLPLWDGESIPLSARLFP